MKKILKNFTYNRIHRNKPDYKQDSIPAIKKRIIELIDYLKILLNSK